MTKDRGRGVFAAKLLKKGELIAVEKAMAEADGDNNTELVKQCSDLAQRKGIEALRMSYLMDKSGKELKIPQLKLFFHNNYKKYSIPIISETRIKEIISLFNKGTTH